MRASDSRTMSRCPRLSRALGIGIMPHSGMPGPPCGPALRSTSTVSLGIAFIVLSCVVFAPLTQTATKFVATDFPVFQVMFFRSLGQTAWMLLFFWRGHGIGMFRSQRPGLQLTRSALLFLSSLCWISAVASVPLTTASAINFTAPIMVVLLSIPLLGERVGVHRWAAVLIGFCGALVVIRPGAGEVPMEIWLLLLAAMAACGRLPWRRRR